MHIVSSEQFTREWMDDFFDDVDLIRDAATHGKRELAMKHIGTIAATLFYEPSTRTRLSFASAAERLGIRTIATENAAEFSSAIKGESLEDTIKTVGRYTDIIVLRHTDDDAAKRATAVSSVPIINAGSGKNEHPTQSLLDLYTIRALKGRMDNLDIVIGGDLKHGRTARSLARLAALYSGNHITFVSTPELRMEQDTLAYLDGRGVSYEQTGNMDASLRSAGVVYWTRLQKERFASKGEFANQYTIGSDQLQIMPEDAIILHPLPRNEELAKDVDTDPRAQYFAQIENGLYVRMALLDRAMSEK